MASQSLKSSGVKTFKKYDTTLVGNKSSNPYWAAECGLEAGYYGNGIAVDGSGNVFTAISAIPSVSGTGIYGGVLSKHSKSGDFLWSTGYYITGQQVAFSSVAVDSSGSVIIGGFHTQGTTQKRGIIAKYTTNASLQWQRALVESSTNSSSDTTVMGIGTDSSNNIYAAGNYLAIGVGQGGYIIKYNSSGTVQWQKNILDPAASKTTRVYGMKVDSSGNSYVAIWYYNATSGYDMGVVKFDSSGTMLWKRALKSAAALGESIYGITLDNSNNVIISATSDNNAKVFIAVYSSAGVLQWQKSYTSTNTQLVGITTDTLGNIYFGGSYISPASRGALIKMDSSGTNLIWARSFISAGELGTNAGGTLTALTHSPTMDAIVGKGGMFVKYPTNSTAQRHGFTIQYPTDGNRGGKNVFRTDTDLFQSYLTITSSIAWTFTNGTLTDYDPLFTSATLDLISNFATVTAGSTLSAANFKTISLDTAY